MKEKLSKIDLKLDHIKNLVNKFPFLRRIRFFQEFLVIRVEKMLKRKIRFEILRKYLIDQARERIKMN